MCTRAAQWVSYKSAKIQQAIALESEIVVAKGTLCYGLVTKIKACHFLHAPEIKISWGRVSLTATKFNAH
jgi:pterin-4a-carbinolamine dehydratase